MAGPQLEDGYTRIAHKLLEEIGQFGLNGTQRGIIDQVWRYTYGFKRKKAELSLTFLAKALKKTKSHVDRELKALIERNVIHAIFEAPGKGRSLEFNKDFSSWVAERRPRNGVPVSQKEYGESAKSSTKPSAKTRTKKDSKDNFKDNSSSRNKKTAYSEDSTYFKMADYFLKLVKKVAADEGLEHLTIKANLQRWSDDFRLLVERDGVDDKHLIRDVMDWVTEHEFWRRNILSAKKMREKFSELAIKMRAESKPKKPAKLPDKEADARQTQIRRDEALRKWMDDGNDPDDFRFDG